MNGVLCGVWVENGEGRAEFPLQLPRSKAAEGAGRKKKMRCLPSRAVGCISALSDGNIGGMFHEALTAVSGESHSPARTQEPSPSA
jgi:hypothetical protein